MRQRELNQMAHRGQIVAICLVALVVGTVILPALCPTSYGEKQPPMLPGRKRESRLLNLTDKAPLSTMLSHRRDRESLVSNQTDMVPSSTKSSHRRDREPLLLNPTDMARSSSMSSHRRDRESLPSNSTNMAPSSSMSSRRRDRESLLSNQTDMAPSLTKSSHRRDREPLLSNLTNMARSSTMSSHRRDRESLLSNPTDMAPSSLTMSPLCDMFSGRWVFDNTSRPLYKEGQCKYITGQLACEKLGRKDLKYRQWRWQPHGCDLPRFNATALLERLRNKTLMFVGDSLNREQWVSLVCMVESSIPKTRRSHSNSRHGGPTIAFHALDYNATIAFYWAPLLVESNCDDPVIHPIDNRIVQVQAIEKHARHWSDVDILIFDSYLWWRQGPMIKVSWGSFASPNRKDKMMKMPRAFKIALNTWSDWIRVHINRSKTQVFFIGMSATHERAMDWGGIEGHNCFGETEPITKEGYRGSGSTPVLMDIVKKAIDKLRKRALNVHVLDITQLSEYRKDAHSSIYKEHTKKLTRQQIANPATYADCNHWCLPGLPDVWNELLYAYILHN